MAEESDDEHGTSIVGSLLRAWVDRRLARAFTEMLIAAKSRLERRTEKESPKAAS